MMYFVKCVLYAFEIMSPRGAATLVAEKCKAAVMYATEVASPVGHRL